MRAATTRPVVMRAISVVCGLLSGMEVVFWSTRSSTLLGRTVFLGKSGTVIAAGCVTAGGLVCEVVSICSDDALVVAIECRALSVALFSKTVVFVGAPSSVTGGVVSPSGVCV